MPGRFNRNRSPVRISFFANHSNKSDEAFSHIEYSIFAKDKETKQPCLSQQFRNQHQFSVVLP